MQSRQQIEEALQRAAPTLKKKPAAVPLKRLCVDGHFTFTPKRLPSGRDTLVVGTVAFDELRAPVETIAAEGGQGAEALLQALLLPPEGGEGGANPGEPNTGGQSTDSVPGDSQI